MRAWKNRTLFLSGCIHLWTRTGNCSYFSGFRRCHKWRKWRRRAYFCPRTTRLCSLWPGRGRRRNSCAYAAFIGWHTKQRTRCTDWRIHAFHPYGSSKPLCKSDCNASSLVKRCRLRKKREFFPNPSRRVKKRIAFRLIKKTPFSGCLFFSTNKKNPWFTRVSSGDGGIRTHVPVTRQLDFESSSLRPLRYVSFCCCL